MVRMGRTDRPALESRSPFQSRRDGRRCADRQARHAGFPPARMVRSAPERRPAVHGLQRSAAQVHRRFGADARRLRAQVARWQQHRSSQSDAARAHRRQQHPRYRQRRRQGLVVQQQPDVPPCRQRPRARSEIGGHPHELRHSPIASACPRRPAGTSATSR